MQSYISGKSRLNPELDILRIILCFHIDAHIRPLHSAWNDCGYPVSVHKVNDSIYFKDIKVRQTRLVVNRYLIFFLRICCCCC